MQTGGVGDQTTDLLAGRSPTLPLATVIESHDSECEGFCDATEKCHSALQTFIVYQCIVYCFSSLSLLSKTPFH